MGYYPRRAYQLMKIQRCCNLAQSLIAKLCLAGFIANSDFAKSPGNIVAYRALGRSALEVVQNAAVVRARVLESLNALQHIKVSSHFLAAKPISAKPEEVNKPAKRDYLHKLPDRKITLRAAANQ